MNEQTKLDALVRILRDIQGSEADDPRLEAQVGDDEAYEEWGRGVGALHLLGQLEPWGGQVLKVCVKFAGTYRPHPAMEPLPGIPEHYLCNGGPDGSYNLLTDTKPGPALRKRLDRLMRVVSDNRGPRLRFYLKTISRSETGFRGVATAAYAIGAVDMSAAASPRDPGAPPSATGGTIRLGRSPK